MLIGKMNKETPDIRRATVDFGACWLDTGEQLTSFVPPVVELLGAWVPGPYPGYPDNVVPATVLPPDPTPLLIDMALMLPDNTRIQMFFSEGTPGNFYRITLIGNGGSGRAQTVELIVSVKFPPSG